MTVSAAVTFTAPVAINVSGMPQVVPADYVGMHFRGWPVYVPGFWTNPHVGQQYPTSQPPAPAGLSYSWVRSHDTSVHWWYLIETSAGVYNWTLMDQWITAHRTNGTSVLFTVEGTPTFYCSSTANSTTGILDSAVWFYTGLGAAAYPGSTSPNGLTALGNFVTALMTRYNSAGGAWRLANPTLGKGIQAVETWNEPQFTNNQQGFFWGTAPQMVDIAYTIRTAVKAVDSSVPVTSPGFANSNTMQAFLTTSGAINTGVTGASTCDALLVHHYNISLPGTQFNDWTYDFFTNTQFAIAGWKYAAAQGGVSGLPLWMGEGGFDYNSVSYDLTQMLSQTPAYRSQFWQRMMMLGAASGFKKWFSYCWDAPYCCTMMNDPTGVQAALNAIAANVSGKTITSATYVVGGAVTLTFSDSSVYTI